MPGEQVNQDQGAQQKMQISMFSITVTCTGIRPIGQHGSSCGNARAC